MDSVGINGSMKNERYTWVSTRDKSPRHVYVLFECLYCNVSVLYDDSPYLDYADVATFGDVLTVRGIPLKLTRNIIKVSAILFQNDKISTVTERLV